MGFRGQLVNEWGFYASNPVDGTQPVGGSLGAAPVPAQNAYGNYISLLAAGSITEDILVFEIMVVNVGISTAARDCLINIGVDPAGGTAYVDAVAGIACGQAATNLQGCMNFRFPLRVRSGSSIGVKASVNSATLTAIAVGIKAYGLPSHPEQVRGLAGAAYCDTYGTTTASSSGTAVTDGQAAEGAWVALGTLTRPCFAVEYGLGLNNSNSNNALGLADISIGDATNKRLVIRNAVFHTINNEQVVKATALEPCNGVTNDILYGRVQVGNSSTGRSMTVHAFGG